MEGLATKLKNNNVKQSKLKFKPCQVPQISTKFSEPSSPFHSPNMFPLTLSSTTLTTSSSSNSTLTSPSSLSSSTIISPSNNSLKNTTSALPVKIGSNGKDLSANYKHDVSTFFSLRSPNELSNDRKNFLLKNVFTPNSNCVFQKNEKGRLFLHNWLNQYDWLCYSPVRSGAYCIYCVLFSDKVVNRKVKFVHLPFDDWNDAHRRFKVHVDTDKGINDKSKQRYDL